MLQSVDFTADSCTEVIYNSNPELSLWKFCPFYRSPLHDPSTFIQTLIRVLQFLLDILTSLVAHNKCLLHNIECAFCGTRQNLLCEFIFHKARSWQRHCSGTALIENECWLWPFEVDGAVTRGSG